MDFADPEGGGREAEDRVPDAPIPPDPAPPVAPPFAYPEGGRPEAGNATTAPPATASFPRARIAALVEVIACSGFPTQVAIAALLALAGVRPFDSSGRLSTSYVFILSVADACALVTLVVWFLRLHGERARDVLLGARPLVREGLIGLLQLPVVFLLVIGVMGGLQQLAPWLHNVARNPMEGLISSRLDAWLFVAVAVVGGGVREEVQRAFILHRFGQGLGGAWLGLLLFSLVFGAGHLIQGRDVAFTTATLGFFWGVVYLRRRSIASTVVSHSAFNATEIFRFALFGA